MNNLFLPTVFIFIVPNYFNAQLDYYICLNKLNIKLDDTPPKFFSTVSTIRYPASFESRYPVTCLYSCGK